MENEKILSRDEVFLKKLREAVLSNLHNEQFGVTELSEEVAISRFQIHRKLKSLLGKSVSQFIREIRLEEAMKMLRADAATAAEIAYKVGFSSPSYFNKCFHDLYGCSPGEVKNRNMEISPENLHTPLVSDPTIPITTPKRKVNLKIVAAVSVILVMSAFLLYSLRSKKEGQVSVAILPLENLTGYPDQAYFVDGMHDALIGELGQISALRVVSRTSTLRYPKKEMLLQDIARELGVDVIVEGSVYGGGDSVRIQLQLIEAFPKERHIWAKEYFEDTRKVLAVHSTIVSDIAKEIQVKLSPEEQLRLGQTRNVNPEIYRAYLRAMFQINQLLPEEVEKGISQLHEAIKVDPGDPLLWAALSIGYGTLNHGPATTPEAIANSKAAARRALELDPNLAEVHLAMAMIALYDEWDWKLAEERFSRALEINPNLAEAHAHYAWLKMLFGDTDKVLFHGQKAVELDPFSVVYSSYLASEYWWLGHQDEAMKQIDKALKFAPDNGFSLFVQGNIYSSKGMVDEALAAHKKAYANGSKQWRWTLGQTYAAVNKRDEAIKIIEEIKADPTPIDTWGLAEIYATLNDADEAFHWLEEGSKIRFSWIPWIAWNPNYKNLHHDARFEAMLKKLNLPSQKQTASVE
jgi:TolB-like protein/AraC-like DNA-binding protein/Tfp pilus assembly protein PilF